uniref:TetR/AcrR family transcriptional regulator n=1 Tax=Nocardia farcinica TaxID=37329 RepID=UPI00245644C8
FCRPRVPGGGPDRGGGVAYLLVVFGGLFLDPTPPRAGAGRARLVGSVVTGAARIRENPLFAKIFRTDTDLMLTYVFGRLGRNQRALIDLFAAGIRAGQADGSIRPGEPVQLAAMLLLIAQSAVQSAGTVAALLPADRLDAELGRAIEGYLAPDGADS